MISKLKVRHDKEKGIDFIVNAETGEDTGQVYDAFTYAPDFTPSGKAGFAKLYVKGWNDAVKELERAKAKRKALREAERAAYEKNQKECMGYCSFCNAHEPLSIRGLCISCDARY